MTSGAVRQALAIALAVVAAALASGCGHEPETPRARNLLLITVDTLRADRVGAYGHAAARTPRLDALAATGVRFERAYAAAPITLPSHATILSGRYPPGHGSRDNGMKVSDGTPTLASELKAHGFRTGAFVGAFPLDHQFGLARGFDAYSDRLARERNGRLANERPAAEVVSDAIGWLVTDERPWFLWMHLFEPHAPYAGDPSRPAADRYDDEIATVDREIGRLLDAVGSRLPQTLVIVTGDHGEAFGEHDEFAHSIFIYDTTLRVPLIVSGPGIRAARIGVPVTLADIAPTAMKALGFEMKEVDGIDLARTMRGEPAGERELYAESFAPLLEFGWAPLRAVRAGSWKYTAAPKPELYDIGADASEQHNLAGEREDIARGLDGRVARYSSDALSSNARVAGGEAAERLRALGYSARSTLPSVIHNPQSTIPNPTIHNQRPDPKDRRELAARMAQVTSGELRGAALLQALEAIVRDDPGNGQARLRLGYARMEAGDCTRAESEFHAALAAGLSSADIHLGLAACLGQRRDLSGAERALTEARRLEPDNPVITANMGILKAGRGDYAGAVTALQAALAADPDLHEARFNLALAYAQMGRTPEAIETARALLARLPETAPQRPEILRLLKALGAP